MAIMPRTAACWLTPKSAWREEFDCDHVSVISDPACEAADCGATIKFFPDQPPAIDEANALLTDKASCADSRLRGSGAGRRME